MINETRKYLTGSSSGSITKIAHFSLQNFSASISVLKQSACSSSESIKVFNFDSAVDNVDNIEASLTFNAGPAYHLALCVIGKLLINSLILIVLVIGLT